MLQSPFPTLAVESVRRLLPPGALDGSVRLVWDRDGERRRIPPHVLANAVRDYEDGMKLVDAGRLGAAMRAAHTIRWTQAEAIDEGPPPPVSPGGCGP